MPDFSWANNTIEIELQVIIRLIKAISNNTSVRKKIDMQRSTKVDTAQLTIQVTTHTVTALARCLDDFAEYLNTKNVSAPHRNTMDNTDEITKALIINLLCAGSASTSNSARATLSEIGTPRAQPTDSALSASNLTSFNCTRLIYL